MFFRSAAMSPVLSLLLTRLSIGPYLSGVSSPYPQIRDLTESVKAAEVRAAAADERFSTCAATVLALRGSLEQASGANSDLQGKMSQAEESRAEAQAEASLAKAALMGARRWLKENEAQLEKGHETKARMGMEIEELRLEVPKGPLRIASHFLLPRC